jgi:hypothetical protein
MIRMKITIDPQLEDMLYLLRMAAKGNLPKTENAVKAAANLVQGKWIDFANGGSLIGVEKLKHPSGGYARSIKIKQTGIFEHEIYSEAKVADFIENGTPQIDMKDTHTKGPKSRISKKGVPYLIVPFRWGTPEAVGFRNVMPINVYSIVKKFKKMETLVSATVSNKKTPNNQNPSQMVGRAQYNKGYNRLSGKDFAGTIEEKTRMNGMVRSTDETGIDRSAGYFTFRVISAKSPKNSWIKPATPPRHVIQALMEETREEVNGLVGTALLGDFSK